MKIYNEIYDLIDFEPWSGAVDTYDIIIREGKGRSLIAELEYLYPEGIDETGLNDILWFEPEWCFEIVGIPNPYEEEEEEEDDNETEEDE